MKPAECVICGRYAAVEKNGCEGGWVKFADFEADEPIAFSHPRGLEFFCFDHLGIAQELKNKTSPDAINELREGFGSGGAAALKINAVRSWWKNLLRL